MEADKTKVFIATPMYGGSCFLPYVRGLVDSTNVLTQNGYKPIFSAIGNDSLITRVRNQLVHEFLKTDAYYFVFIDADIGFFGEDVLKLIKAEKDLICGLYPKKLIDWGRLNTIAKQGYSNLQHYAASYVVNPLKCDDAGAVLEGNLVEVRHAGTGFMLITRDVFEKLSLHVKNFYNSTLTGVRTPKTLTPVKEFFYLGVEENTNYFLSEDYQFCELWRKHGGKVYADLSIALTHTGTYMFEGDLFLGGANLDNN